MDTSEEQVKLIGGWELSTSGEVCGPPEIVGKAVIGIKAPEAWLTTQGENTVVAVASTGIQGDHDDLRDNFLGATNFTNEGFDDDRNGHGTKFAGIVSACKNGVGIVGVAPKSKLYSVKVLTASGGGTFAGITKSFKWLASKRFDVVCLGFGSGTDDGELKSSIAELRESGTTIVTPYSHNRGQPIYPGNYEYVISTADFNATDVEADLFVKVGFGEPTTHLENRIDKLPASATNSAPFVAGVVCLIRARFPELSPIAIRNRLISTADIDNPSGRRIVNALRAIS